MSQFFRDSKPNYGPVFHKRSTVILLATFSLLGCGRLNPFAKHGDDSEANNAIAIQSIQKLSSSQASDSIEIKIALNHVPVTATWSIYFGLKPNTLTGLSAIARHLSPKDTSLTWQTSLVKPGTYFLATVVSFQGVDTIFWNSEAVVIARDEAATVPVVAIQSPQGKQLFKVGGEINFEYSAVSGTEGPLTYSIEFSPDSGGSWQTIAENLSDSTFKWPIPSVPEGPGYQFRISAIDDRGKKGSALTTDPMAIISDSYSYEAAGGKGGQIKQVLMDNCYSCHSADNYNGRYLRVDVWDDVTLANGTVAKGVNSDKEAIVQRTRTGAIGQMPPDGNLSNEARDLLLLWQLSDYARVPK